MRVFASISPWLPWLKGFLSPLTVLEEKAAELYHLCLLEKPISAYRASEAVLGVEKGGKALGELHDHLLKQGFQKRLQKPGDGEDSRPVYFREDLGALSFVCPQIRPHQKHSSAGLAAFPDKRASFLMENTHSVNVAYLGCDYEVRVPQVGRFILDQGSQLKVGRRFERAPIYQSSQRLLLILDLLVSNEELVEEMLNDFLEIRPPSLVQEFLENLRKNGPGSVLWDSTERLYLERHPGSKTVFLTSWYWKFLPSATRFMEKHKERTS